MAMRKNTTAPTIDPAGILNFFGKNTLMHATRALHQTTSICNVWSAHGKGTCETAGAIGTGIIIIAVPVVWVSVPVHKT